MRVTGYRLLIVLIGLGLIFTSCAPPASDGRAASPSGGAGGQAPPAPAVEGSSKEASSATTTPAGSAKGEKPVSTEGWLSAREAAALAYNALNAPWKASARLSFVGRFSGLCNDCSPFLSEDDEGIGSDGRQLHWLVVLSDDTASDGKVFHIEGNKVTLVKEDIAIIRPKQLFEREGWVDSTEIQFQSDKKVGLDLKTSDTYEGVDAELEKHPLLWMAETSFRKYDIYDAQTGAYIKSR